MKKTFYRRMHNLVAGPIRFFNRIKVYGEENVPESGGLIICANHIAAKDVFMIGASCKRDLSFIAKKELFSIPVVGWFLRKMGAVRVDRGGSDVGALRKSVELLHDGKVIAIFPQGHRNPGVDPSTTEIKSGAALIAYRSGCTVLPVFIQTKNNKYRPFGRINIIFGKPISTSELDFTKEGRMDYDSYARFIFGKVIELGGYSLPSPTESKNNGEVNKQ